MSNKLVKKTAETKETKNVREEIKFNTKDLIIMLLILAVGVLKEMYLDIPELFMVGTTGKTVLMVASIIGFLVIAIVCGSYQSKVQGDNITVASVLNDKNKPYYMPSEKALKFINGFMRTTMIALAGYLVNISLGTILVVVGAIVVAITTIKHKFKIMDIAYTAYTIGMLGIIFTCLING